MGFVKLSDDLPKWAWYRNNNALSLYIRLLLAAEWEPRDYQNVHLERGQLVTTVAEIATNNKLSIQQTKNILAALKSTNKITIKSTNKFSIITLIDYDLDLQINKQNNKQTTNKITENQQTNNKQTNQPTLLNTEYRITENRNNARAREGEGLKNSLEEAFARFWSAYPKKTAKQSAYKAWIKLKPDKELTEKILSALERHKKSVQWLKDNGQFIPYPATWLNGKRWEDNLQCDDQPSTNASSFDMDDVMKNIIGRYKEGKS